MGGGDFISRHRSYIFFLDKQVWTQKCAVQNQVWMSIFHIINFKQLHHSACENLLGINIDSNLNWKNQIDQICSKIPSKI